MVAINALTLSALALTLHSAVPVLAAAAKSPAAYYPQVTTRCYTSLCAKSTSKVKTSWSTKWQPCTKTTTVTSKSATTPAAVTCTSTTFVTTTSTAPASFETQSSTITETETDSTTTTNTVTEVATTIVSATETTTVPTSSGFVPVRSSLFGSSCDSTCGNNPVQKRGEASAEAALFRRTSPNPASNPFRSGVAKAQKFPQSVECIKWSPSLKCSTRTKTATQIKTAATPTTTIVVTSTITETFVPSATTTVSETTTSTVTSIATESTTSTSTTTSTSVVSVTTLYAACATNNLASRLNGALISTLNEGTGPPARLIMVGAANVYDCCVANILSDKNQFFAFQLSTSRCFISSGETCPAGSASKIMSVNTGSSSLVVGNGNCAQFIPNVRQ